MTETITAIPDSAKPAVRVIGDTTVPRFVREEYLKDIKDLELRDTDVIVVGWPKSGTTWMQYIVSQVIHGKEYAPKTHLKLEFILLEISQDLTNENSAGCYKLAHDIPPPRLLRSHLLMRFLPRDILKKRPKVIYVARNPKDAVVSHYHFYRMIAIGPIYSWDDIVDQFCEGLILFGDWFQHTLEWWKKRDEPNVLFVKYEDMKKDLKAVVSQVAEFLNKSLTEDEVRGICNNSSFENMKKTPNVNPDSVYDNVRRENGKHITFMRKGEVGDWKNWFTVAQNERIDKLYEKRMAGSGLEFSFE